MGLESQKREKAMVSPHISLAEVALLEQKSTGDQGASTRDSINYCEKKHDSPTQVRAAKLSAAELAIMCTDGGQQYLRDSKQGTVTECLICPRYFCHILM